MTGRARKDRIESQADGIDRKEAELTALLARARELVTDSNRLIVRAPTRQRMASARAIRRRHSLELDC